MSTYIPTLPLWPAGTPLPAKARFLLYDPDTDLEYAVYPEQLVPDAEGSYELTGAKLRAKLKEGYGIKLDLLPSGEVLITCTVEPAAAVLGPDAPSDGQVDDEGNTLSGLLVAGFPAAADYEVFGVPGFEGITNLAAAGGDVQNGRVYSRGLAGPIGIEKTGIRVAASGNRPAGSWLLNDKLFTGPAAAVGFPYTFDFPLD